MDRERIVGYINNDKYRKKALRLYNELRESYDYLKQHKPSLGNFGEHIIRDFLKMELPNDIGVAQGFVQGLDGELSSQCDIIIYKKDENAIVKSFGNIQIILSTFVLSVIEVKTRIQYKTFASTLKAFEKLAKLGCFDNYIIIYNAISPRTLCTYFYPVNKNLEDFIIGDNGIYDHGDQYRLPVAIYNLQSNYYLCQDYIVDESDEFGYVAYQYKDDSTEISCLQIFIGAILDKCLLCIDDTHQERYTNITFNDLKILFSYGLWRL